MGSTRFNGRSRLSRYDDRDVLADARVSITRRGRILMRCLRTRSTQLGRTSTLD